MKKLSIYIFSLAILSSALPYLNAKESQSSFSKEERGKSERFSKNGASAEEKATEYIKESKLEIRSRLARNVSSNYVGDVEITLPEMSHVKKPSSTQIPLALGCLVKYTLPTLNLEEMYKVLGEIKAPSIDLILPATDKYLANRNAGIRSTSYSQYSVKSMIDAGLPIFVYLKSDNAAFTKIAQRSESRPSGKMPRTDNEDDSYRRMEEYREKIKKPEVSKWLRTLQSTAIKRFTGDSEVGISAIISGYNKTTKELQLTTENLGTFWIAEPELKLALIRMFSLKF